ncbi:MAG: preprotein translocase subunit SecY [Candidatus Portnoybacteria bacterium RIFCSPLOWO2_12_FULL_39_9]|uniref:Protein translocase subunit SecY n=1 Tax=Candidatus Portnoybacteria bacterium RIFCSPHIGHO2_12_FULL_38_9 TaxID=1801997 RepID=A0A1G2FHE9_9BACT|nr:MAG: preprotein translocase subunit SecY [Candidatus Portnoybacteria bacterium RBG_13_40_8]OGZ36131.1 MAG: preprotein translocase subunit SecY [Candidatus Portnoybacteria bacterium RIFCSPHIGHO2_02_FULL_39_12]OGZ37267.1 MAG: preprotein translocase subunit SecY [Candidatus Portnoybacteria bacterium RIFCSPHIGHO2_12_FULL_38_9]OGZ39001.1 MAG: preprotein translocase subunit SecY [Candidatus Portnoybacteria bacterium RIFCSPLOWO2_01_FULL_38_39]OGZ40669.1 MAG: preprotein translocase subunit SecY [Can
MRWHQKIIQIFKIKDLRKKILFVLMILVIFRIAANIPVPGIDAERLRQFFGANQLFGLLNIFTGGAMENMSIVMLGLGPFITATIIMQLLTMIFPQLEALYKEEGEAGRQKFNQYARMLTVPLAALQSYGMLVLLSRQNILGALSSPQWIISISIITAGALFLMWLGELISEKGIGNGVSLLIFAGIVAQVPISVREIVIAYDPSKIPSYLAFLVLALVITASVVYITEGRRNIPVSYAKRIRGRRMYGGVSTYLPLNVNPAGVIPIIFALSIMLFPGLVANFMAASNVVWLANAARFIGAFLQNPWFYGISYFILVVLFTYFYTAVTFDPKNVADNLQKMGGFIPGIRPGKSTSDFLYFILNRVLLFGAIFLGTVAVLPSVVQGATGIAAFGFVIGGTALLIVVSVVLETVRQIESQLVMREYEGF